LFYSVILALILYTYLLLASGKRNKLGTEINLNLPCEFIGGIIISGGFNELIGTSVAKIFSSRSRFWLGLEITSFKITILLFFGCFRLLHWVGFASSVATNTNYLIIQKKGKPENK
jgi:hypothetical protein